MSTLSTIGRPAPAGGPGRLFRWLASGVHVLLARAERRAAIKMLRRMDDRELRDIGISRSQIEGAVGGAFNPGMGKFR